MEDISERQCISAIIHTARAHRAAIDRYVRQGLSIHRQQHMMLMTIARRTEPVTQRELSELMEISEAAVTSCLKRLEAEGYVHRAPDPADGRTRRISISEKGRELVKKTDDIFAGIDRQMFCGITKEEMTTLCQLLSLMQSNLDASCDLSSPPSPCFSIAAIKNR